MRVLYTQCTFNIYSAFIFVHFIYPLHSTCSWIILSTANIVICIRSFLLLFSVKTPCNLTFFRALAFFFCLKLLTPSSNLVASLSQLTYSYEALSVALIKDRSLFIRISWSRRFKFLSFVFFSLEPSLLIILLAFFRDRFVYQRFMSPSTPLLLYFSNLPEIVFLLVRHRLCHRPSFLLVAYHWPRTVYLPCRPLECSSTLISSGLFCFPYLLVLPESHFICKYILHLPFFLPPPPLSLSLSLSALTFLEISILQFTFFWMVIFFYCSVTSRRVTFRTPFSI